MRIRVWVRELEFVSEKRMCKVKVRVWEKLVKVSWISVVVRMMVKEFECKDEGLSLSVSRVKRRGWSWEESELEWVIEKEWLKKN